MRSWLYWGVIIWLHKGRLPVSRRVHSGALCVLRVCEIVLILFVHFQAELFELAGFEHGGCVEHDIASGIVFRERDAVADRVEAGEE